MALARLVAGAVRSMPQQLLTAQPIARSMATSTGNQAPSQPTSANPGFGLGTTLAGSLAAAALSVAAVKMVGQPSPDKYVSGGGSSAPGWF